jgi:hypothetical protein
VELEEKKEEEKKNDNSKNKNKKKKQFPILWPKHRPVHSKSTYVTIQACITECLFLSYIKGVCYLVSNKKH